MSSQDPHGTSDNPANSNEGKKSEDARSTEAENPLNNEAEYQKAIKAEEPEVMKQLQIVTERASKLHKATLSEIFGTDASEKEPVGFKDSEIRKHHEAVLERIITAFDKTFEDLVKIIEFQEKVQQHRNKLTKMMETQLLLCLRRQDILLEKLLMQVKLATCGAEDYFDSLEKPKTFSSEEDFNKNFEKWSDQTIQRFHELLKENKIDPHLSWEFELRDKLKEKEAQIKRLQNFPTAGPAYVKIAVKAEEITPEMEIHANIDSTQGATSEQVPNVQKQSPPQEIAEQPLTPNTTSKGENSSTPSALLSGNTGIPTSPVAKQPSPAVILQRIQSYEGESIRNIQVLQSRKVALGNSDANVGIYLDGSILLVGSYDSRTRKLTTLLEGRFLLDVEKKCLAKFQDGASPENLICMFQALLQAQGVKRGVVTAFFAAISAELKTRKCNVKRVAFTFPHELDEDMQKMIVQEGKEQYENDFRMIPYESAVVLGHCSPKELQSGGLPSFEEKKVVVCVENSNCTATTVLICKNKVSRVIPPVKSSLRPEAHDMDKGTSDSESADPRCVYVLDNGNQVKQISGLKDLEDANARMIDVRTLSLHGVSILASQEEEKFQCFDKSTNN